MKLIKHKDKYYIQSESEYSEVICSTDPSLKLPLLPQSFLQDYVTHQGKIELVEIETECSYGDECPSMGAYDKQHLCNVVPKLINNEVIVTKVVYNNVIAPLSPFEQIICNISIAEAEEHCHEPDFYQPKPSLGKRPQYSQEVELEKAANEVYNKSYNGIGQETQVYRRSHNLGFANGTKWKEQQQNDEAIEFAEWYHTYKSKVGYREQRFISELFKSRELWKSQK